VFYKNHHRRCVACGTFKKIHLHHVTYERLYAELDDGLRPLCYTCRRNAHEAYNSGRFRTLAAATDHIIDRTARRGAMFRTMVRLLTAFV
jgi:hypothetical protein